MIYFHIGHIKCMSTSIQAILSNNISQKAIYSGFIPNKNPSFWFKDSLERLLFDYDLRLSPNISFKTRLDKYINYYKNCTDNFSKDLYLSSETITSSIPLGELDMTSKIKRFKLIISQNKVTYVVIFRELFSHIFSIYKETLKVGSNLSFFDFLEESFLYRDCCFIRNLNPFNFLTELLSLMESGDKLICFFPNSRNQIMPSMEDLKNGFLKNISIEEINNYKLNKAIKKDSFQNLKFLNYLNPLGRSFSGIHESHRIHFLYNANPDKKDKIVYEKYAWKKLRYQRILRNIALGLPSFKNKKNYEKIYKDSKLGDYLMHNSEKFMQMLDNHKNSGIINVYGNPSCIFNN